MENKIVKEIASERVVRLLELAESMARENTDFSRKLEKRYVSLAREISAHYRVKIPKGLKYKICKKCNNFLIPGINCTVRKISANPSYVVYKCECGAVKKVFLEGKPTKIQK